MSCESASYRIDAYCACLYQSPPGKIRAAGRTGVPLHRASRHAWTDVIRGRFTSSFSFHCYEHRYDIAFTCGGKGIMEGLTRGCMQWFTITDTNHLLV